MALTASSERGMQSYSNRGDDRRTKWCRFLHRVHENRGPCTLATISGSTPPRVPPPHIWNGLELPRISVICLTLPSTAQAIASRI